MLPEQGPISVVVASDSLLIGDGLTALLATVADIDVIGRARNAEDLLVQVKELDPDAVIISIRTPVTTTMATIEIARQLRNDHPQLGIVVISDRGNGFALELLRGGASNVAFLLDGQLPNIGAVLGALRDIRAGQTVLDPSIVDSLVRRRDGAAIDDLTLRELDVLEQMANGLSNRRMAATMHLSVKAIEKNVTTIFRKLGLDDATLVDRRVSAALIYLRAQTMPLPWSEADPPA